MEIIYQRVDNQGSQGMSHIGGNGRSTGNLNTAANETEEEEQVERSLAAAIAAAHDNDTVTTDVEQTPIPAQRSGLAAESPSAEDRTVLATRKKAQLRETLSRITEEVEAAEREAARELFAESWGSPGESRRSKTDAPGGAGEDVEDEDDVEEEPDCADSIEFF